MLDKDKKVVPTATRDANQGLDKKKDLPVDNATKKKDSTPTIAPHLRRTSIQKNGHNGVQLSPVKVAGKENDMNSDNPTTIPITTAKEISVLASLIAQDKKEISFGTSPSPASFAETQSDKSLQKLQGEIESCHSQISELKNANTSLQSQLTESKRKKENLQVQIKALEQAEKQQKEKEKEFTALLERKHQQELESVKAVYERKMEEKRVKRQAMKMELRQKKDALEELRKKTDEVDGAMDAVVAKAKSDAQLAILVREALEAKLQALTETKEKETSALHEEIHILKRHYFMSVGIAVKLSRALMGEHSNLDLDSLFENVMREEIPYQEWARWVADKMLSC